MRKSPENCGISTSNSASPSKPASICPDQYATKLTRPLESGLIRFSKSYPSPPTLLAEANESSGKRNGYRSWLLTSSARFW